MNSLKVLDCTLRDGGQGLEDLHKNGINVRLFSTDDKTRISDDLRDAGIDIIELGCMAETIDENNGFAQYKGIRELSAAIPQRKNKEQMFVGLYIGPDTDIDKIPPHSPELVDGIRVILRYSELQKSLDYCSSLSKKGYKVFVQPMLTMRYTDDEIDRLICNANEMNAYALYFVDSYGYMSPKDIYRFMDRYNNKLDKNIYIGFHAHNNMDMAFSNACCFIDQLPDRRKIVDSCALGMGQGAGNLQTELIINHLNSEYGTKYDFDKVLDVCDVIEKFREHDIKSWGYSPLRLIPAIHKAAYKYAVAMRLQYNMSLVEINRKLANMPNELKNRYTPDNLKKFLDLF